MVGGGRRSCGVGVVGAERVVGLEWSGWVVYLLRQRERRLAGVVHQVDLRAHLEQALDQVAGTVGRLSQQHVAKECVSRA